MTRIFRPRNCLICLIWNFVADIFGATLFIFKDLTDIVNDHQRGEVVVYLFLTDIVNDHQRGEIVVYLFIKSVSFMPTSLIRPLTIQF